MNMAAVSDARPRLMIADDDPVVRSMLGMLSAWRSSSSAWPPTASRRSSLRGRVSPTPRSSTSRCRRAGGLRAVLGIREVAPATAIVVLSGDESDGLVRELMQAGAITYRRKGVAASALAQALSDSIKAHSGGRPTCLSAPRRIAPARNLELARAGRRRVGRAGVRVGVRRSRTARGCLMVSPAAGRARGERRARRPSTSACSSAWPEPA